MQLLGVAGRECAINNQLPSHVLCPTSSEYCAIQHISQTGVGQREVFAQSKRETLPYKGKNYWLDTWLTRLAALTTIISNR